MNFSFLILSILLPVISIAQQSYQRTVKLMGSRFDITVVAKDSKESHRYIEIGINEIKRIERLISSWDPHSQTSAINRNAGVKPIKVSVELFQLIERALQISKITDGAFDISYASMDRIWKFDGSMTDMPTDDEVKSSVSKVDYHNILLDKVNSTVFLKEKGMKIGFGAIGKGYAADKAKDLLTSKGVSSGIINASGDMRVWGKQHDGNPWKIAITNPLNKNKVFAMLPFADGAVVTSGNYEKFITFDGKRYSHIIDPRTGYPSSGLASVTVFAPSAELSDALATSVFVMGIEAGLHRINQLSNVECIIIDDLGKIIKSNQIQLEKL